MFVFSFFIPMVSEVVFCLLGVCADEQGKFDELVDDKGVKILVDPKALMHVIGTKMDFVEDRLK